MDPMLKFTSLQQQYPELRAAAQRKADYHEIYGLFSPPDAQAQSSRCSQCGVPFCQVHCPLQNNIPDWLKLTAEDRLEEAYAVSSATNTFPEICGRICPQDRLCEGNCVINKDFGAVTIGSIEKFLTETAFANGWVKPVQPLLERTESIGIIGAGPAGLAAAEKLRQSGYQVTVYDRYDRSGGLMMYGIPGFKLEKDIVLRRQALLEAGGVHFVLNCNVGTDIAFEALRQKHQAVLIATGVYKARELGTMGDTLDGIIPAMAYLTTSNRVGLGDAVPEFENGEHNAKGKRIVVIGGGDTAMDCVRTAIRQGATKVTCLYRRDQANMPGSQREVQHAVSEGVEFLWLSAPRAFSGKTHVEAVLAHRMRLVAADASGRKVAKPIEGETFTLEADLVIKALGFDAENLPVLFNEPRLATTPYGTLAIKGEDAGFGETSLPGVFAAGDIVRGASLVVWGIRDGREVAQAIQHTLRTPHPVSTASKVAA